MNRLQTTWIVLFLIFILIVFTILFFLPADNLSSRVVAAREVMSPTDNNALALDANTNSMQGDQSQDEDQIKSDTPSHDTMTQSTDEHSQDASPLDSYLSQDPNTMIEATPSKHSGMGSAAAPSAQKMSADKSFAYDVSGNKRDYVADHKVKSGDWFSTVTGKYWDDLFMWPDLYTMNTMRTADPDLIYPDENITIYQSLTADGDFSEDDRQTVLKAYIKVYKMYKALGTRKDLAAARLLAAAVRYDAKFLENHKTEIKASDLQKARALLSEQKLLD